MFTSWGGKEVEINILVGLEVFLLGKKDGHVIGWPLKQGNQWTLYGVYFKNIWKESFKRIAYLIFLQVCKLLKQAAMFLLKQAAMFPEGNCHKLSSPGAKVNSPWRTDFWRFSLSRDPKLKFNLKEEEASYFWISVHWRLKGRHMPPLEVHCRMCLPSTEMGWLLTNVNMLSDEVLKATV